MDSCWPLHIEAILRGTTVAWRRKTLKSIKDGAGLGDACGVTLDRIMAQGEGKTKLVVGTLTLGGGSFGTAVGGR